MAQTTTDISLLESCVRTVLNVNAPRAMAVLKPLKVTIENFPSESKIELEVPNFPQDESRGTHKISFDRIVYLDSCDFNEVIKIFFIYFFLMNKIFRIRLIKATSV